MTLRLGWPIIDGMKRDSSIVAAIFAALLILVLIVAMSFHWYVQYQRQQDVERNRIRLEDLKREQRFVDELAR